jgi:hypothetical protein
MLIHLQNLKIIAKREKQEKISSVYLGSVYRIKPVLQ